MLPAILAADVRRQILYYLAATFDFRDKEVEKAFGRFLEDPDSGLFKGPWVQLRRPFRPADKNAAVPFDLKPPFHPFKHQWRAWQRLSSKDQSPRPTLVTTGTGSGKTECFLYPLLDHCLRARQDNQPGIKAIILYPMNALAADQERRFARTIWSDSVLRSAGLRVGLYTGRYDPADPSAGKDSGTRAMGADHGISNQAVQQESPPDILLTNYKMLDFLLMRPQDQRLWRFNEPGVLRYIVLDELHTYDGAQGADVACLLRRLKERLGIARGELCFVGTSATIESRDEHREGSDGKEDAQERLARFASTLFEEPITPDCIIGEDRLEVEEIVNAEVDDGTAPLPDPTECLPRDFEDAERYAMRLSGLWGGPTFTDSAAADPPVLQPTFDFLPPKPKQESFAWSVSLPPEQRRKEVEKWSLRLGDWLKKNSLFKRLLDCFRQAEARKEDPLTWREMIERVSESDFRLRREGLTFDDRHHLLASFFALIAQASEKRSGRTFPLVPTQVQLWVRELRRLGRVVADKPAFMWLDEPIPDRRSLPTFHCSECGESGWVSLHDPDQDALIQSRGVDGIQLADDPQKIYRAYFGHNGQRSPRILILSPWRPEDEPEQGAGVQQELSTEHEYLCPASLVLRRGDGPCPLTNSSERFRVKVNRETRQTEKQQTVGAQGCPCCGSQEGVFFIGSQSATIASVAIDEMYGSTLNSDPKLLAFTDSVQDASHRAGFFTARTYHFTFRTALQHLIDDAGPAGVPLEEVGKRLLDWWSQPQAGRPGSLREAIATLLPPDLRHYHAYLEYREGKLPEPPPLLRLEVETRLAWEAASEFGLMQTHGRTMEKAGSSCLAWDGEKIDATVGTLRAALPGIDPMLTGVSDETLRLWLFGWLLRYRERGALYHPYLDPYAKQRYWGKYPFGKAVKGRETYSPAGHYKPNLLVTQPERGHEHALATIRGNQPPWHVVWGRRVLHRSLDVVSLLDLTKKLLECGVQAGLLKKLHQDGNKEYFALAAGAASLVPGGVALVCSESGRCMVRPEAESELWRHAPSLEYSATHGRYQPASFTPRQRYYQDRYHKGALRRVVAEEHTGLLATEEREHLERSFAQGSHRDDPNVLTCTSTLEMGIDIGDLSSTMLCSIPPSTASYLQRIGRAGRITGTALILSVVNQRPHDLFFYARPVEMLRGRVDPPGCWLDASAVLVRQYLAFCFDQAAGRGELKALPRSGRQLIEDLEHKDGHLPRLLAWATQNEAELHGRFLKRFEHHILDDTRARFREDAAGDVLAQRVHQASREFEQQRRELVNAQRRLRDQLDALEADEEDARKEIEQEQRILKARLNSLDRTGALEILTDHGLLPNYAFPERGVRFHGAVYNRHRGVEQDHVSIELTRGAGTALRELAPGNHFYTHARKFDIQQISIGNKEQPLVEQWAVCGACGHMRPVEELRRPDANPSCPQCGHDGDSLSQTDVGQQRRFVEYARSQALSYMEHYESLSGDRDEERQREYYQLIPSFDHTLKQASGAVGDDALPFGIEYRSAMVLREVNVGADRQPGTVPFGPGRQVSETGFQVCQSCGVVVQPGGSPGDAPHRRSCTGRRKQERLEQQGKQASAFSWENVYLYRQLRSEAIRLLLPLTDDEDLDTLAACLYLGLRLRFEGDPAHLLVASQVLPDPGANVERRYLVLMDAVPGGTGYLKALYQSRDAHGRPGEGILDVLRRARDALETCACRKLKATQHDTDGCYRCIRTYHQQYRAAGISRERGIRLLNELIAAGEKRAEKVELASIKPDSLYGSVLEKRLVETLKTFVEEKQGTWEKTIIKGGRGFRFSLPGSNRLWELELQPKLGPAQGVSQPCQPDFLLTCDDGKVKPVAIFADGFEFHCHPNNRLADDARKRRSILQSGLYHCWSVTWDDVTEVGEQVMVCQPGFSPLLERFANSARAGGQNVPSARQAICNGMSQLKAFLDCPHAPGWGLLSRTLAFFPLSRLTQDGRCVEAATLRPPLESWASGSGLTAPEVNDKGEWVYNERASLNQDVIVYARVADVLSNRSSQVLILGRLGDSEAERSGSDYRERWRRFLACLNLYQFCDTFRFWTSAEAAAGQAPELLWGVETAPDSPWLAVRDKVTSSLRAYVSELAAADIPVPEVECYNEEINDDAFAELAWRGGKARIALLAGDQTDFASKWQQLGWKVVTTDELQAKGVRWLIDLVQSSAKGV